MSKIVSWSVKKPGVFVIIFLALIASGILSYVELDKQEDPNFEVYEGLITTSLPGAGSGEVEQTVTTKIEASIQNISEIDEIISYSYPNVSIIHVILHDNVELTKTWDEVKEELNDVTLPEYADSPELKVDVAKTAFSIVHLSSLNNEINWEIIRRESKELEQEFIQVDGINSTEIIGLPEQELSIELDLDTLAEYDLSWQDISQILSGYQFQIPEGNLKQDDGVSIVQTISKMDSIDEIENIPIIREPDTGTIIFLKDIASIEFENNEVRTHVTTGQNSSVSIVAYGDYHTDARKLGAELSKITDKWKEALPDHYEGEVVFDQSKNVDIKFSELFTALFMGMAVVILVCFLTLSFRTALITGMSIPISIVISLFFMNIWGIALHQISLAALIVVIGILVDDSIVSNENIERHVQLHNREGITQAIYQIAPTIIISTLCLVIGFAPLIYLEGDTGQFIRALPQVMTVTLLVSTFVALLLVPSIRAIMSKKQTDYKRNNRSEKVWNGLIAVYKIILAKTLKRYRMATIFLLLISTALLSLALVLNVQFFPKSVERSELIIDIELPIGSSKEDTKEQLNRVTSILEEKEGVKEYISYLGRGLPRVYYNENSPFPSDSVAQLLVLIEQESKGNIEEIVKELQHKFNTEFQTSRVNIRQFEQGPPTGEPIQIRVTGKDLQTLSLLAEDVTTELSRLDHVIQEYNSIGIPQQVKNIEVDYDSAVSMGVVPIDIALTNRLVLEGVEIGEYQSSDHHEMIPIILESTHDKGIELEDLKQLKVPTQINNGPVSLHEVASISGSEMPALITRYNGERVVFISAYVDDDSKLPQINNEVLTSLGNKENNWEEGYKWSLTGEEEQRGEAFNSMYKFFFLSVSMIFALLYILFHSVWRPLIVLIGVYMSIGGAMGGLYLANQPLGFMSLLGIIGLSGIVVRNGMMLVEFTDMHIQNGCSLKEALTKAGSERLRPILITTLTTVGGMVPMALIGGSLWAPLAITIISGLIFSTFLTLLIVPSLYFWFRKDRGDRHRATYPDE
ncbi:efflux RND transporter permease subunit [Virgibacillus dokdonensis]|nr:efflux RND transporter permease subunit [Virgibacillus dokdonensis]